MSGPPNFKKSQTEALAVLDRPAKAQLRAPIARPHGPRVPPPPLPPVTLASPEDGRFERLIFPAPIWMVARLEVERKRLGLRSRSETIRHFLEAAFK